MELTNVLLRLASTWLFFALIPLIVSQSVTDLEDDRSDWVDPGDMINYDSSSKSMKKRYVPVKMVTNNDVRAADGSNCDGVIGNLNMQLAECQHNLQSLEKEPSYTCAADLPYLRRYARILLKLFSDEQDFSEDTYYNAKLKVSPDDYYTLKNMATLVGHNVDDTYEVLQRMIVNIESTSHRRQSTVEVLEKLLGIKLLELLQVVCIIILPIFAMWIELHIPLTCAQQLIFFFLFLFLISIPWNWLHLYKIAVSKKHAEIMKVVPKDCMPSEMTWQSTVKDFFQRLFVVSRDKCSEYHEAVLVDPLWEVPPTKAFAVTITKLFLEPAEHIGVAFNKLFSNALSDLPFFMQSFVIFILLIFSLLALILGCGYAIKFPYFLGAIEPSDRFRSRWGSSNNQQRIREIRNEIARLQKLIDQNNSSIDYNFSEGNRQSSRMDGCNDESNRKAPELNVHDKCEENTLDSHDFRDERSCYTRRKAMSSQTCDVLNKGNDFEARKHADLPKTFVNTALHRLADAKQNKVDVATEITSQLNAVDDCSSQTDVFSRGNQSGQIQDIPLDLSGNRASSEEQWTVLDNDGQMQPLQTTPTSLDLPNVDRLGTVDSS